MADTLRVHIIDIIATMVGDDGLPSPEIADMILALLPPLPVLEGLLSGDIVAVPKEATATMVHAAQKDFSRQGVAMEEDSPLWFAAETYRAMLAADKPPGDE